MTVSRKDAKDRYDAKVEIRSAIDGF